MVNIKNNERWVCGVGSDGDRDRFSQKKRETVGGAGE